MDETDEASNAGMVGELEPHFQDPASKQPITSNEAISCDKGDNDVVIIYSTSFGPTLLNYA